MAITREEYYIDNIRCHRFIVNNNIIVDNDFMTKHNIDSIKFFDGELWRWWIKVDKKFINNNIAQNYLPTDEMFEKFITNL
jgi:hypothetical protein